MRVRFGEFTYEGGRRLLLRGDEPVRLSSKALELLGLLLLRRPDAVSKEEIQDVLWPDALVTETTVATLVTELRAVLGDAARAPRHIRTAFGFGYAFDGTTEELGSAAAPPHRHALLWGSRELPLPEGTHVLGREPSAAVPVVHPSVSREHVRLTVSADGVVIEDAGSKNGTRVNGRRIEQPTALRTGDEVGVGSVVLVYVNAGADVVGGSTVTLR